MSLRPEDADAGTIAWMLSSAHNDAFCAMDWIDPKYLRRIDKGTQPELNGYVWWFCTEPYGRGTSPRLKRTMLCGEHSEQMLLEKFAESGFFDESD